MTRQEEVKKGLLEICRGYPNEIGNQASKTVIGTSYDVDKIREDAAVAMRDKIIECLCKYGIEVR